MLTNLPRNLLIWLALAACAVAAPASAAAQTLPDEAQATVRAAGGQLFWVTETAKRSQLSLYTRPAAGGAVRLLGTVPGLSLRDWEWTYRIAFDGANYALVVTVLAVEDSGGNCGVCEGDETYQEEVIAGTLSGAPRVLSNCTLNGGEVVAFDNTVAIAGGRTFFAGLHCGAPAGVLTLDANGALASFDPTGTLPLQGSGNWLAYGTTGATKMIDLAGSGSYTVPVASDRSAANMLVRTLLLQSDGSIVLAGRFYRTGGTTAAVPVRTEWSFVPETVVAGDRLLFASGGELFGLGLTTGQAARRINAAGIARKRPLSLTGSMLDVAASSCAGAAILRTIDIDAAAPALAADGCPVEVTQRTLRLTAKRTITVPIRCANGCTGTLALESGDVTVLAKVNGTGKVRFKLTSKQRKAVRRTATFRASSLWLTVDGRQRRLKR